MNLITYLFVTFEKNWTFSSLDYCIGIRCIKNSIGGGIRRGIETFIYLSNQRLRLDMFFQNFSFKFVYTRTKFELFFQSNK